MVDLRKEDITEKLILISPKRLYFGLVAVIVVVASFTAGYFNLNSVAMAALKQSASNEILIERMSCDVRQLKNYMIHGVKPSPIERCQ